MKFRIITAIIISSIVVFQGACVYEVETPNVCFQEDVLPIFVNKCGVTGCHNSMSFQNRMDLTTYEGIMLGIKAKHPNKSEYFNELNSGEMPPKGYPGLTRLEKNTIKNWIRLGAPNSSNCNPCDSSFSFQGRIQPLINKWCIGCHTGTTAGGGYDLSNHANIVVTVTNGKLLGSIKHQSGFVAMPQNAKKLSECDIKAVEKWIDAGANP